MIRFYIILLSIGILFFSIINLTLKKPKVWEEQNIDLSYSPLTAHASNIDTLDIELHYKFINQHFNKPYVIETPIGYTYREDQPIKAYYESYTQYYDSVVTDIGNWGLGMINSRLNQYSIANEYFNKVQNKSLKYYNNERGLALLKLGYGNEAANSFKKEIAIGEKDEAVFKNLSKAYYQSRNFSDLNKLIYQSKLAIKWDDKILNDLNFMAGNYPDYLLKRFSITISLPSLIASVLIGIVWLFFLFLIIRLKLNHILIALLTCLISMFTSFLCFILYDFYRLKLGFTLTGGMMNDFLYCFLGIGLIEEIVKIIPFLFIYAFLSQKTKPIHLFIYAGASAIGFATVENLLHFKTDQLSIIHSRGLMCVISHIFDTSIIVYLIFLSNVKGNKNFILNLSLGILLAAFSHGVYDFWLLNKYAYNLYLYTFIFMFISMFIWIYFINNALNLSVKINDSYKFNNLRLKQYLIAGLFSIVLIENILNGIINGADKANDDLYYGLVTNFFFIAFLSIRLTNINLLPGYLASFDFNIFTSRMHENSLLGKEFILVASKESLHPEAFPITGKLISKVSISEDTDYFLFVSDLSADSTNSISTFVLKSKGALKLQSKKEKIDVSIFIPTSELKYINSIDDFKLLDKAVINLK